MTRYEKLTKIDNFADLIYDMDMDSTACRNSPYRVNNECPHDENDIGKENCRKCIKAWLESED